MQESRGTEFEFGSVDVIVAVSVKFAAANLSKGIRNPADAGAGIFIALMAWEGDATVVLNIMPSIAPENGAKTILITTVAG